MKKVTFDVPTNVMACLNAAQTIQPLCTDGGASLSLHNIPLLAVNPLKAWAMLHDWDVDVVEFEREVVYRSGEYLPYLSVSLKKKNFDIHFFTVTFKRD